MQVFGAKNYRKFNVVNCQVRICINLTYSSLSECQTSCNVNQPRSAPAIPIEKGNCQRKKC